METVYEADNNIEAHMIVHLLERTGIDSEILGEHLQGGVGELAAIGNIRVVVDPGDAVRAKSIISDWESKMHSHSTPTNTTSTPATTVSGRSSWSSIVFFCVGVAIASAYWLWAFASPVDQTTADYNRDGEADEWLRFRGGLLERVEQDRNHDGAVDGVFRYTARNSVESASFDDDFDGEYEFSISYEFAHPKTDELDLDGDGYPERRSFYVDGVLSKTQFYRPGTTTVRKTQMFDHGTRLIEARVDVDDDGIIETLIKYDSIEEEVSREKISRGE